MNKPIDPVQQCPSCHLQSIGMVCGGGKRRINQTEKEEYYKTIDCTLWVERRIEKGPGGIVKCPTCGQVVHEPVILLGLTTPPAIPPFMPQLTEQQLIEQVGKVFSDSTVETGVISDPFADIMDPTKVVEGFLVTSRPAELASDLDWGITVMGQEVVDALFPGIPPETPPKPHKRRSGEMPKAKFSPARRKKMEAEATK
jgi:hypothetical protein